MSVAFHVEVMSCDHTRVADIGGKRALKVSDTCIGRIEGSEGGFLGEKQAGGDHVETE